MKFRFHWLALGRLALAACWLSIATAGSAAELVDMFADRQTVTGSAGQVLGSNTLASVELNEPQHGGKPGGRSVWITWVAPADGIATFDTLNSDFDTLLGVYYLQPGTDPPMSRLHAVGENDDDEEDRTSISVVQFGAIAGTNYQIAVDGYQGLSGNIQLNWKFVPLTNSAPTIVSLPNSRAMRPGDSLFLSVGFQASSDLDLTWFYNGKEIPNAESATLVIPNFQATNVGHYKLRIETQGSELSTPPIEVQINSEGITNALATDKLLDAPPSGIVGQVGFRGGKPPAVGGLATAKDLGVVRGYNGTQIFDTTYATTDPNEPQHCGLPGGASYWFSYLPPTNGIARLDTDGSNFDTILAVYSYTPPLVGYQQIVPVACDNNSGSNGLTSRLQFTPDLNTSYLIVVTGLNGARGIAYLNYSLTTAPPPDTTPPSVLQAPQSRSVAVGSTVAFTVLAGGAPPLSFLWFKDGTPLAAETNASLSLTAVQVGDAGAYSVELTNAFGAATSAVAVLSVILPPSIASQPLSLSTYAGAAANFVVNATGTPPLHYRWNRNGVIVTNLDAPTLLLPRLALSDAGFYTVDVMNTGGLVRSAPAGLGLIGPAIANLDASSGLLSVTVPVAGPANPLVDESYNLDPPVWSPWAGNLSTNNGILSLTVDPRTNTGHFFRAHF
jgi:hypothetical protein